VVDKIRAFHNHPGFVEAVTDRLQQALATIPEERREAAHLVYTAHSIHWRWRKAVTTKTTQGNGPAGRGEIGTEKWRLVYQSRSGPASQPWLEPDILDCLREIKMRGGSSDVVIAPIGFVSDHMEILFDLDTQARELSAELGLHMVRAGTVGTHPRFLRMIRELICERMDEGLPRCALGVLGRAPTFVRRIAVRCQSGWRRSDAGLS